MWLYRLCLQGQFEVNNQIGHSVLLWMLVRQQSFYRGVICSIPAPRPANISHLYRERARARVIGFERPQVEHRDNMQRADGNVVLHLTVTGFVS